MATNMMMVQEKARPSTAKDSTAPVLGIHGYAEFFSSEVFHLVLCAAPLRSFDPDDDDGRANVARRHNPTTAYRLQQFCQTTHSSENMEFLEKVDRYNALVDELIRTMSEIHQLFTSVDAPRQINISDPMMRKIDVNIRKSTMTILPSMEMIFAGAEQHVKEMLCTDIYPRFVKYQMTTSAARALANDRHRYQGLGDCFCLTAPSMADNPIVHASDGFVKVTGYSRADVIPRNCRFLQGKYTDRAAVRRLRLAIDNKQESVELLLNYKKNGDPFWNLLYVAPLFDADGHVAFYIGGQINCSTTVHSYTDILRILSTSDDPNEDQETMPSLAKAPRSLRSRRHRFKSFWNLAAREKQMEVREAGMEAGLVKHIEKMSLGSQMKIFYTAYSKYLVLDCEHLHIRFHSRAVVEILAPMGPLHTPFIGRDVFRVLSECAIAPPRNFKSDVKKSVGSGLALSVTLRLAMPRANANDPVGDQTYVTHWTPLKDDQGTVTFIVLTLSR
ncbi:MAG: hypothetical protein M1826_002204 [Phylliscum demangeonii]|nr:MAG: hypothetical protein M1826_002204 [Phylliscum demangeonii]